MSMFRDGKTVSVDEVDNGWVFTWSRPSPPRDMSSQMWPRPNDPKTSGREIFTDKKKMLKRLEAFL